MPASQDILSALQEYTTCDVSDALCSLGFSHGGFLPGLKLWSPEPQQGSTKIIGPAYTVKYVPVDDPAPKHASHYIDSVPEGAIIFISSPKTPNAVYGGLMSTRAQASRAAGTIVDGRFRDLQEQRALNYPARHPRYGGTIGNLVANPWVAVKVVGVNVPIQLQSDGQELTINPGDYLVGDLNGVVVLPQDQVKKALPLMAKQGEADAKMAVAIKEGMPFTEASRKFRI
ncbi:4-hydroxy-4-methyl-2-oxoglutarate aldolase [Talaromyces pinophilus]|nr:4-hydroxy-4-methyl-2-oxoglutarate aldolase [Talaromyces pinophilus]